MRQTRACAILGDLYLSGEGVDKDDVRARFYHNIACSSGRPLSPPAEPESNFRWDKIHSRT